MKRIGLAVLIGIVALGAIWFVWNGRTPQEPPTTIATEVEDDTLAALPATFAFSRLQVETASDAPEACLVFSEDLDESGTTNYEDYLQIRPALKPSVRIAGPMLCLGGLAFNQTYQVTIREGMPAASGDLTAFDEVVPVELRDRPAAAAFGGGVILPRDAGGVIPVTTVNIDTLSIRVLRVGDRLLSQLRQGLLDDTQLYRYDADTIETEQGALIWQGEMDIESVSNSAVVTNFPIAEVLGDAAPGAYLVLAEDAAEDVSSDNYWRGTAAQWVIETDLGLTTFQGDDGLHVFVRSLNDAHVIRNVELTLIARNNDILGTRETGANGEVAFEAGLTRGTGGEEPVAVMAYGPDGDFAFLDLRRAAFDFSDRGVSGRATPGPIDAFLYTERGIYRPGETVQLTTLLRNRGADALDDVPLTIVVTRPDGVEFRRETFNDQDAGAHYFPVTLSRTAPFGMWRARAYVDTNAPAVGSASFEVQDFVPERLEVTATPRAEILNAGDAIEVDVRARFLYGAPAANMGGEAELRLSHDYDAFEGYSDFHFGRVEEALDATFRQLSMEPTDADGETLARGSVTGLPTTTWPLRGQIRIGIFEPGGRSTQTTTDIAIRTNERYLGIRSAFDGRYVREGSQAAFDFVAVDRTGTRVAADGAHWEIIRETRHYQWYEVNGEWRFEPVLRENSVRAGILDIGTDLPAQIAEDLPWGTYRLVLTDASGEVSSSVRFYSGWWGASSPDRPDQLIVTADADGYAPGGTATLTIRPEQAGPALIVIANDRVIETRQVDVPEDGMQLSFDISDEWGAGAYALVTHYRPLDEGNPRAPVRAVGVTYLAVDHSARVLEIALDVPEVVAPQQHVTIPVQVTNMGGEQAYLTLAAVDQGILQLTGFEPPNPEDYYFGKRRLGVDMRDDYGRLIEAQPGAVGPLRTGGDSAIGGAGLTVVPTRTVALFSGLVQLDAEGRAEITFDIPDFAGELRLMAVAVSQTKVGQTDARLTVRDAVVGELSLPRFLAPGDNAFATLSMHNVEGAAGNYTASFNIIGGIATNEPQYGFDLAVGEREEVSVPISVTDIGIATVELHLSGPDGFDRIRTWPIQVRPAQLPETREVTEVFTGGTAYTVPSNAAAGLIPATVETTLSLSTTRGLDVGGLLRALARYPYGCLEQTTSRAFPLLLYGELATEAGIETQAGETQSIEIRLQNAIDRVLDMQRPNGAFGMWGSQGSEAEAWLSIYAIDFLLEADRRGYVVPDDATRRGLEWASGVASQSWRDNPVRAYAFYVLAKEGRVVSGDLRYFHDTVRTQINDVMALAMMGGALDAMGDRARAASAFDRAIRLANEADPRTYVGFRYGSLTRDVAGLTAIVARGQRLGLLPGLFERIDELAPRLTYTTTQEKAWLLFAAEALVHSGNELSVSVTGAATVTGDDPVTVMPTLAEIGSGVSAANNGGDIWRSQSVVGVPAEPQGPLAEGLTLTRSYFNLDGTVADLAKVEQNDRVVVVIQGRMADNYYRQMVALDLLPAGFEIESLVYNNAYPWLPDLTYVDMQEARDDRYVAAFDIGNRYRPLQPDSEGNPILPTFAVAYLARAITPGTFVRPPAYVEDMYQPRITARTEMGTLTVTAAD